jgi:hypothetical protein
MPDAPRGFGPPGQTRRGGLNDPAASADIVSCANGLAVAPVGDSEETPRMEDVEYEEINSDDVDRVVAALEDLTGSVSSETIKAFLEECSNNIYYLVYDDEDGAENLAA